MRVTVAGDRYAGRVVDLQGVPVTGERLAAAVRRPGGGLVEAPAPGPLWGRVGHVRDGMSVPLTATLAAAVLSRGSAEAAPRRPPDGEQAAGVDLSAARERVATAGDREDELRERVATLRGELRARRDLDAETADVEAALREAAASLSEATTERVAAEEALSRARRRAREHRDQRSADLRARDRADNRERDRRARLADRVYDEFAAAVRALPGEATAGETPAAYDGPDWATALGAVAVGEPSAPVVVEGELAPAIDDVEALDAPVVLA